MYLEKSIEFKLKCSAGNIEKSTQKSAAFLRCHGCSDKTIHSQVRIIRELILCTQKFDTPAFSEIEMSVQLRIETDSITVEVKKSVNKSSYDKLAELDKIIQWIRGYQDPFEHYPIVFPETASALHTAEASALRLSRLAYETNAMIDFYVSEDNVLNLSAVQSRSVDSKIIG